MHNRMASHGPDAATYAKAVAASLKPEKIDNSMAFMFESRYAFRPTRWAMETPLLQQDYDNCWQGFAKGNPSGGRA